MDSYIADSKCLYNNVGSICLSTCLFFVFFHVGFFLRQVPFTPERWRLEIPDFHSASSASLEEKQISFPKVPCKCLRLGLSRLTWSHTHSWAHGRVQEGGKDLMLALEVDPT